MQNTRMLAWSVFLTAVISIISTIAFASPKIVDGKSEFIITSDMNQSIVEKLALEAARKNASEVAGSFIVGEAKSKNGVLQNDNVKVLLRASAELIPGSEHKYYIVINKTDNTRKLFYTASFEVDEEEFKRRVKEIENKEKIAIQKLENEIKKFNKLDKESLDYKNKYRKVMQELKGKDILLLNKNLNELDNLAKAQHYSDLAHRQYNNRDFLLAEMSFLEVAKCYELLQDVYGYNHNAKLNAASAYYKAGVSCSVYDPVQAMIHANKALQLNPEDNDSLSLMGICAWKQSRYEEAVNRFKEALNIKEDLNTIILLANIYLFMGETENSKDVLNRADRLIAEHKLVLHEKKIERTRLNIVREHVKNIENFKNEYNINSEKQIFLLSDYEKIGNDEYPCEVFYIEKVRNGVIKTYYITYVYYPGNQFTLQKIRFSEN